MPRCRLRCSSIPPPLAGWVLINSRGIPRYWATVWANVLKADLSEGTRGRHLAAVEKLYQTVAAQTGRDCLDQVIGEEDYECLEAALGGFLTALRNESAIAGVDRESTWASAMLFIKDVMEHLAPSSERQFYELDVKLRRLLRLYEQISPSRPKPPAPIRALPAVVIEDLYRLLDPASPDNPFRTPALRWRNFLIFLMLLHLGLRRGELAMLPADVIKEELDPLTGSAKFWLNVDETAYEDEDSRYELPSLKTPQSRRQLPVSRELVKVSDTLVQNYRRHAQNSFLLVSQEGRPLALRSLHLVFETLTQHLSEQARMALAHRGKHSITAHDLRHTCAVYRLARYVSGGDDLDKAIDKLRFFFGWSATSQMPRHYARAYFETRLAEVWNDNYDAFVGELRTVEGRR